MKTAYLHRACWSYEESLGIVKIHHTSLGIFAILYDGGIPQENVNFLEKEAFHYYWKKYNKLGIRLEFGYQVDRDVELTRVYENENLFKFPEINLDVKLENNKRYFRPLDGEWQEFEDDVFVEYQPCKSLIDVR